MGWAVAIWGGLLTYAGFADQGPSGNGSVHFTTSDKWGVAVGAIFILAGMIYESRRHR